MEVPESIKQEKVDYDETEPDVNFETNTLDSMDIKLEPIKIESRLYDPEHQHLIQNQNCNLTEEAKMIENNDKSMYNCSNIPLTAAEKSRRYRQKINEDPEKRAEYLRKCRERAAKQKSIDDLSEREKRVKRKKWRENQQRSRRQKTEKLKQLKLLEENTPPSSPVPGANPEPGAAGVPKFNRVSGRRKVAKRKSASYRKIQQLEQDLEKLKKSKERYKKRYLRVKKKLKKPDTPKNVSQEDLSPFSKMSVVTKGYT